MAPIILPSDNKLAVGSSIPIDGVDGSEWARLEPLLTPDLLKTRHLFGIDLMSAMKNRRTNKFDVMTDDMLKDEILRAVRRVEIESGIHVLPVYHQTRLGFDRNEYMSFGYLQLPVRPIASVQSVDVISANGLSVYRVPNDWISPGHFHQGQINFVPLQPTTIGGGFLPSTSSGGSSHFISILGSNAWIPEYWQVSYTSGFEEGKLPGVFNEIIGADAAIDILGKLQATRIANSHSLGVDGLSQSISTAGPQIYQPRIEQLKEEKAKLMGKLKALFALTMFSTSI